MWYHCFTLYYIDSGLFRPLAPQTQYDLRHTSINVHLCAKLFRRLPRCKSCKAVASGITTYLINYDRFRRHRTQTPCDLSHAAISRPNHRDRESNRDTRQWRGRWIARRSCRAAPAWLVGAFNRRSWPDTQRAGTPLKVPAPWLGLR